MELNGTLELLVIFEVQNSLTFNIFGDFLFPRDFAPLQKHCLGYATAVAVSLRSTSNKKHFAKK